MMGKALKKPCSKIELKEAIPASIDSAERFYLSCPVYGDKGVLVCVCRGDGLERAKRVFQKYSPCLVCPHETGGKNDYKKPTRA